MTIDGGTAIADPFEVTIRRVMRGGAKRSQNGTYHLDYFSTTFKRTASLKWRVITAAQRDAILAKAQLCMSAARTMVLPDGTSFSVWYDAENEPIETVIRDATGYKYNLELTFIED